MSGGGFTLLPAVDIRGGRAVRLVRGRTSAETVYDDDPVAAARRWVDQGAGWLHVVDLDAAFSGEPRNRHLIAAICEATGAKVQASGGVRSLADIDRAVAFGASRVVIGTMALRDPGMVADAVAAHGARIAVGLDAEGDTLKARGWTEESGALFPTLERLTAAGVTRFVFTDINRDGTLTGPNVARLRAVADATTARVTASGGVARLEDLCSLAACHPRVDAAIVGKALYAGRFSVTEALQALGEEAAKPPTVGGEPTDGAGAR